MAQLYDIRSAAVASRAGCTAKAGGAAGSVGFISWDVGAVAESKRFCASPAHDSVLRATGARTATVGGEDVIQTIEKNANETAPSLACVYENGIALTAGPPLLRKD